MILKLIEVKMWEVRMFETRNYNLKTVMYTFFVYASLHMIRAHKNCTLNNKINSSNLDALLFPTVPLYNLSFALYTVLNVGVYNDIPPLLLFQIH